jgi:hypothetical protein
MGQHLEAAQKHLSSTLYRDLISTVLAAKVLRTGVSHRFVICLKKH